MKYVYKYKCQLVKDSSCGKYFASDLTIDRPSDVVRIIKALTQIDSAPSEQMWVLFLDCKGHVTGCSMASSGGLSTTEAGAREIFRGAILANAAGIIITHNHPSGNPQPSMTDLETTHTLIKAGELLGIKVTDHVIIGVGGDDYYSMRENGNIE